MRYVYQLYALSVSVDYEVCAMKGDLIEESKPQAEILIVNRMLGVARDFN